MKVLTIDDNLPLIVNGVSRIPDDIGKIIFSWEFDQPLIVDGIKALPNNLQHIEFRGNFNQPLIVDGLKALPDNLQHLRFGGYFNQSLIVDGLKVLPDNLQHIEFGHKFNQPLSVNGVRVLPYNLKKIIKYGKFLDLYQIPLSVNEITNWNFFRKIDRSIIFLNFKLLYKILPLPIAEEIAYHLNQEIGNEI